MTVRRVVQVTIFLIAAGFAAGVAAEPESRIRCLEDSLLAPCCYQEPVSTHRSEASLTMKAEIARFVSEGKSDREILDYYKAKYGERVLVEPEGARWWVMNVVPVLMTLCGLAFVIWLIRRMVRPIPASSQ